VEDAVEASGLRATSLPRRAQPRTSVEEHLRVLRRRVADVLDLEQVGALDERSGREIGIEPVGCLAVPARLADGVPVHADPDVMVRRLGEVRAALQPHAEPRGLARGSDAAELHRVAPDPGGEQRVPEPGALRLQQARQVLDVLFPPLAVQASASAAPLGAALATGIAVPPPASDSSYTSSLPCGFTTGPSLTKNSTEPGPNARRSGST
jgi:hypothetical protein